MPLHTPRFMGHSGPWKHGAGPGRSGPGQGLSRSQGSGAQLGTRNGGRYFRGEDIRKEHGQVSHDLTSLILQATFARLSQTPGAHMRAVTASNCLPTRSGGRQRSGDSAEQVRSRPQPLALILKWALDRLGHEDTLL